MSGEQLERISTCEAPEEPEEKGVEAVMKPRNPGKGKAAGRASGPSHEEHDQEKQKSLEKKENMEEKDSAGKTGAEAAVDNVTRKRKKRTSRKEILELLQHKNEMLQDMEETIQRLEESIKNKDDRIVRMVAEFENFRKRTRREWELLQKQANAELIKDILGILDDFDRALEAMGEAKDHFHSGVRMIYGGLLDILKKAGLREVAALEKPFDPQYHEAMGEIESDEVEPGFVAHVVQKGYLLNDQLLRPARVVVSKGRKPEEEPDE